jgi:hypothetical protein
VISHSGFTPPSNVSGLIPPPGLRSAYPRGRHPSDTGPASIGTGIGAMTTSEKGAFDGDAFARRPSGGRRVAFAAFAIVLAGGAALFAAFRGSPLSLSSQPEPAASSIDSTSSAVGAPSSSASAGPEPVATAAPEATVDAAPKVDAGPLALVPVKGWVRPPPHAMVPAPKPPAPVVPTAPTAPKPTSTSFMPPVRNPGF